MLIFELDNTPINNKIINNPKVQIDSQGELYIHQVTGNSITLMFSKTYVVDTNKELSVYYNNGTTNILVWTGFYKSNGETYSEKENTYKVTYSPSLLKLKKRQITKFYDGTDRPGNFQAVIDDVIAELNDLDGVDTWNVVAPIDSNKSVILNCEFQIESNLTPHPNDGSSWLNTSPFFVKLDSTNKPFVNFTKGVTPHETRFCKIYKHQFEAALATQPSGYYRLLENEQESHVTLPLSGDNDYGIDPIYVPEHDYTYFRKDGSVWGYGIYPVADQNLTLFYSCSLDKIVMDLAKISDSYFYILGKTLHVKNNTNYPTKNIVAKKIEEITSYSDYDYDFELESEQGFANSGIKKEIIQNYYNQKYGEQNGKVIQRKKIKVLNSNNVVFPGENLTLNGTNKGVIINVSYDNGNKITIETIELI